MTAQPATTPAAPPPVTGGPPPPPGPTPEQVAAAVQARRDAVDREAVEAAAQRRVTEARLRSMASRLLKEHPVDRDHPDGDEAWTDVRDLQARRRMELWRGDISDHHVTELASWTLDDVESPGNRQIIAGFVQQVGEGSKLNLILAGGVGSGKTSAGVAAGHACVARGLMTRFMSHEAYLRVLRASGEPPVGMTVAAFRARYRSADVVVWDDFGAEHALDTGATEFVRRETLELLGDRVNDGKATIVTTNLTTAQINAVMGDRIASRLGSDAVVARFDGRDRREPVTW